MIVVMEPNATDAQIDKVVKYLEKHGFRINMNHGDILKVIAAIGDKRILSPQIIAGFDGVKCVKPIQEPYKLASRTAHPEDTVIKFPNGVKIGGKEKPVLMVGPCSVEKDINSLLEIAKAAKEMGCEFLRG